MKEIAKKIMGFTAEVHNVNSKSSISRYFSTFFEIQEIQGVSKSPVKWHSAMHGHLAQISPSSILKVTTKTMWTPKQQLPCWTLKKTRLSYRASHQFGDVPHSRRKLPLRTAVVSLCLLHLDKLLIQSLFLKEQFLCMACLDTKVFLQSQNHSVFAFYLIHLEKNKAGIFCNISKCSLHAYPKLAKTKFCFSQNYTSTQTVVAKKMIYPPLKPFPLPLKKIQPSLDHEIPQCSLNSRDKQK